MENIKDEQSMKFFKYWEERFNKILAQNTNWTKLFMSVEQNSLPDMITMDKFCNKYSQDFQLNISYRLDDSSKDYDLTITR